MQRRLTAFSQTLVMGDHNQCRALFLIELKEQVGDALTGAGIQIAGRLVSEKNVGLAGECTGYCYALLLSAGQLRRVVGGSLAQTYPVQQLSGALAGVLAVMQFEREHDVFQRRQASEQLEGLKDEADMLCAQRGSLILIELAQWLASQYDLAGGRQIQPGEQAEEGRFARARGADNRHAATAFDAQADIVENGQLCFRATDDFAKVAGDYHAFGHGGCLMKLLKKCLATCLFCLLALPAAAQNILIVGDSISAAFGLEIEQGWVPLLQERISDEGYPHRVVNASVSGDTTAGGHARLPKLLEKHEPELVVIELGGNDGLRGLKPTEMQQNLAAMVDRSRDAGADVVLLGMRIPPNYGVRYTQAFEQVFADIHSDKDVPLMPFFLADVAEVADLMQSDRIHPTAQAQPILLENAWPLIKDWLDQQ